MSEKGVFAVMRYSGADEFLEAQEAMATYWEAHEIAKRSVAQDPRGVCIVVRVIAVYPGKSANLNMDTWGEA